MSDKFTCFYHPDRETRVTCGRCERPLCPDCVRHGATGVRCRECITLSPRERGLANPQQIRSAALAAFGMATGGGLALGWLGWVTFLPGAALGFAVGAVAFLASGRHRDITIQAAAALMALAGILLAAVLVSFDLPGTGGQLGRVLVNVSFFQFVAPAVGAVVGALIRFVI
jgi:hypothetical protein